MKLKSLLLGSAAALVAVSGARAADAVVIPEPEAVEYVRVCDAAGAGYFYIPGGETCLKISGYVQYQINLDGDEDGDAWEKAYEARLQFNAWRATDFGDLATVIRLTAGNDANPDGGAAALNVDRAYFDLAGLRVGLDASAWDYGFGGPADAFNQNGPTTGKVAYTANFGAGSFTLSLEEDRDLDYIPSVVAVLGLSAGDFSATIGAAYDEEVEDFGVKATASYAMGVATVGFGVQYSGTPDGEQYMADYEWVLGADVAFDATDALSLGLGVQYGINEAGGSDDDWVFGASASYDITETLNANIRLRYFEESDDFAARIRFKSSF